MSLADELLAACEDESLAPELHALLCRATERIAQAELYADYLHSCVSTTAMTVRTYEDTEIERQR